MQIRRYFPGMLKFIGLSLFWPFAAQSQGNSSRHLIIDSNAKASAFAPGVVSTTFPEWSPTFAPNGKTVYFVQGTICWTIVFSTESKGKWLRPRVASFSGRWKDSDPFISPDGKRLFFISNRPLKNSAKGEVLKNFHIWYVDRLNGDKWGPPHHIDSPVNIDGINNFSPSISKSGTLYFSSINRDGHQGEACYYAEWNHDHYEKPRLLLLNGNNSTSDLYVAPDESYLIFLSGNNIYITYHQDHKWSAAEKLAPQVNSGDPNSSPSISLDDKILYYSSNRISGLISRDQLHTLNYDDLLKEMRSIFNRQSNILWIPVTIK